MDQYANASFHRWCLRPPQRDSLEILAKVREILELEKNAALSKRLEIIQSTFPTFEPDLAVGCYIGFQGFKPEWPGITSAEVEGFGP